MHVRHASGGCSVLAFRVPLSEVLSSIVACQVSYDVRFIALGQNLVRVMNFVVLERRVKNLGSVKNILASYREESIGLSPDASTRCLFANETRRNETLPMQHVRD